MIQTIIVNINQNKKFMKKITKSNRAAKGSIITVSPIRKLKDIRSIQKMLAENPRDLLLFTMGINNGLRAGDLLKLKVGDLKNLNIGSILEIRECKTNKKNILAINKPVFRVLRSYLDQTKVEDEDFLFKSRKGKKPLTIQSVNRLIKKWTSAINLKGNYGAHTLRKTWGYHQRVTFGVGFEIIAKRYNHSSPVITMRYLGIEDKEVHNTLMNEIG